MSASAFAAKPSADKPRRRILLIDDTPQIAELLTFALRDHGYEVVATGYTDDDRND